METTSIVIGVMLLGLSLVFVNRPFQEKKPNGHKRAGAGTEPRDRRESVLSALRDLDFDYKTGKVSEDDYNPLRAQLLAEAAQLTQQEQEKEDQLEALIRSRRNRQQEIRCEECGASIAGGEHFCSNCGSPVKLETCPSCGSKIKAGDFFCTSCGNRLELQTKAVGQA